ncbi:LPXTG cell wall anchor domain-containing protein [Lactobacillus helveticus]|nr:LPXTG cell wall anchor domain-containing protein [Lactobacillus helveticus]
MMQMSATKVTEEDITKTVTYASNGHIIPVDSNEQPIPGAEHPISPTDPDDPTKVIDGRILVVPGYKPEQGKTNDPVAPAKNPTQNVNVPYIKESTQPPAPDNPTPQPTPTPEPKKPETPKTPEKDNTPEPDEPDEPDAPTPRRHHKNKKHTSASKPMNNWSNNRSPYGENSNYKPIGETAPGNGESILPNGEVVDHNGNVVGYVDANGKIHHSLPQTGESNNENVAAAVLGRTAVALGLIGLTGVKRRHTN